MEKESLIKIFARCFRGIAKMSAVIDDSFFIELLDKNSDSLLGCYINFLKNDGSDVLPNHVVQYWAGKSLVFEIKNLLNSISVLRHLDLADLTTPLLLERDLLLVESIILNKVGALKIHKKSDAAIFKKIPIENSVLPASNITQTHKEIAQFVINRGQVRNIEVFSQFSGIARRTLKRKLSELVKAGAIRRLAQGKKVFYGVN